jgi:hypothetical protein
MSLFAKGEPFMKRVSILFIFLIFVIVACSGNAAPGAAGVNATEPPATSEVIPDTGSATEPPTPEIVHKVIPSELPENRANHAGDQDSSVLADKKQASGGDRFTFSQFERPFNGNSMDIYYANLDILDVTLFTDDLFVYGSIIFKSLAEAPDGTLGGYAMEFDLDLDGTGDVLVITGRPGSTDWTTDGVQVWFDANNDVGGQKVVRADETSFTGDGYESKVFDSGTGNDPDLAWVRISPSDANTIQIAVKLSLFNDDTKYLVGVWAGNENLNPALFDLNDYFTHEQAGAALPELEVFYPIKALSELDNTCRLNIGFDPNGNEPGLCPVPGAPQSPDEQRCTATCSGCGVVDPVTCTCDTSSC